MVDSAETPLNKRSMSRNAKLAGWRVHPVWRVLALLDAPDGKTYARLANEGDDSVQKTVVLCAGRARRLFQKTAAPEPTEARQVPQGRSSPV